MHEIAQYAKAAVKPSEFDALGEALPNIVWQGRADGTIDYFNASFFAFTGTSASPQHMSIEILLETLHPFDAELRIQRADENYVWFAAHATPLRNESGEVQRWFATCIEADGRKRSNQIKELRKSPSLLRKHSRHFVFLTWLPKNKRLIASHWHTAIRLVSKR